MGAFALAALAAALFGMALWFSARTLSNRRWISNAATAAAAP